MIVFVDASAGSEPVATAIGIFPVASVNNWNNTAFSKLCTSKPDDELLSLAHSDKLDSTKQAIVLQKLVARCPYQP